MKQEWGSGNGICIPELLSGRVGMHRGGGGRGGRMNRSPRSLSSFLSNWELLGRVSRVPKAGHPHAVLGVEKGCLAAVLPGKTQKGWLSS